MPKGFDTYLSNTVAAKASLIKSAGFDFCALYYFEASAFKQQLTRPVAQALTDAGLYVVSLYENGCPTQSDYFSGSRGVYDGRVAAEKALEAGQPAETAIIACVDYDASTGDLEAITDYFTDFRHELQQDGYTAGVYGSGMVCRHLSELGLVSCTHLSQSTGFPGYADWKASADIVQGPTEIILGMDCDSDETNADLSTAAWCWQSE